MEKSEIEIEMGSQLEWRENSEKTSSQIALFDDFDLSKQDKWEGQHKWFKENIEKFDQKFYFNGIKTKASRRAVL